MADLDDDKKGLEDIGKTVKEIFTPIQTLSEAIGLMVAHGDKLNRNFALGRARIEEMKLAFTDAAAGVEKLGGNLDDVSNTLSDIAKASNRNVLENEEIVSKLYASSKVLGIGVEKLVDDFKDVGYETSQIGVNLENSIEYIQSVGLNAASVMQDVSKNMDKMNRYQFEGGVSGLAKMAAQASMLRFDMAQTFSFADKMLTPENAINMASAFQRLGVTAGNLVDPFVLMNESINDPTGLQNSLARLGQEFTYFDEETKSFKINPQGVLTLRQMEEEAGLAAGSLSKSALAAADLDKRLSEVNKAGLTLVKEEDKQYLANIANMDEGTYKVTLEDGTKKELAELTQPEFDKLIEQQKNAPKTVEDIQRSQLSATQSMASDLKAIRDAGYLGTASSRVVSTNVEGLRNIITKFADQSQKALPKTGEVRAGADKAIEELQKLYKAAQSEGGITSEKFLTQIKTIEDSLLKKGESMGPEALKGIQEVLIKTAENVKGSSDVEKFFRSGLLDNLKPTTKPTTQTTVKPLSRSSVMGSGTATRNYSESISQTKEIKSQVDFGGTITIKVDAPPGVSEQQFKTFFESDEFKRKVYEYYNQKAKELERK